MGITVPQESTHLGLLREATRRHKLPFPEGGGRGHTPSLPPPAPWPSMAAQVAGCGKDVEGHGHLLRVSSLLGPVLASPLHVFLFCSPNNTAGSLYLLSTCCMPVTLPILLAFTFLRVLGSRGWYFTHCTREEMELSRA